MTWAASYDAVLKPAPAQAALLHGALDTSGDDPAGTFRRTGRFMPFSAICTVTGQPAIALPLYTLADGLPLAVQLIGRPPSEGPLLALAARSKQCCRARRARRNRVARGLAHHASAFSAIFTLRAP